MRHTLFRGSILLAAAILAGCAGDQPGRAGAGGDGGAAQRKADENAAEQNTADAAEQNTAAGGGEQEDGPQVVAVLIAPSSQRAAISSDNATLRLISRPASGKPVTVRFQEFNGQVALDDGRPVAAELKIFVESLWSDDKRLDEKLRSADGFDFQRHPHIAFESSTITPVEGSDDEVTVTGEVTCFGATREITFPAKFRVYQRHFLEASATIPLRKSEFGIPADQGGLGDQVTVELQIGAAEPKGGDLYSLDRRPDLDDSEKPGPPKE